MSKWRIYIGIECNKMKPTLKHRPAIWENMLGTVFARNEKGETKYFDYDYEGAKEFAGVTDDCDPRLFRNKKRYSNTIDMPPMNKLVLYIKRSDAK